MRRSLATASALLVVALAGCGASEPASSEEPEPSTDPSQTASVAPTASASDEPDAAPRCGDAFVLAMQAGGTVGYAGTDEEVLAQSAPTADFAAPEALDGLDVLCAVTFLSPTDGGPGTVEVSIAFLGPEPSPVPALEAWATDAGYVPGESVPPEWFQPTAADGSTTQKVVWITNADRPLDEDAAAELSEQTGVTITPDVVEVIHYDFTVGP